MGGIGAIFGSILQDFLEEAFMRPRELCTAPTLGIPRALWDPQDWCSAQFSGSHFNIVLEKCNISNPTHVPNIVIIVPRVQPSPVATEHPSAQARGRGKLASGVKTF